MEKRVFFAEIYAMGGIKIQLYSTVLRRNEGIIAIQSCLWERTGERRPKCFICEKFSLSLNEIELK